MYQKEFEMAKELLLSSQAQNAQLISCCFWDYNNGNILQIYKHGGSVKEKSLNLIGADYVITAEVAKPLLHLWALNSQETLKNVRLVLPEPVTVLQVCPKGNFIAAGIGTKLYVWELCTGMLLTVQSVHYQPITCIKFSSGSECLLVAGQDGMIVCYQFSLLISNSGNKAQRDIQQLEPVYKRMDHPLAVTDMHIEKFGFKSRFASVSLDCTLRLYQLSNGELLLTLVYTNPLTALTMDCFNIYVGNSKGSIQKTSLSLPSKTTEHHVKEDPFEFIGHKGKIVALDLNIYNTRLASASEDSSIILWDIKSCQILKRLELKSIPSNIKFVLTSDAFFAQNVSPKKIVNSIQRTIEDDATSTPVTWIQHESSNVMDELVEHHQKKEQEIVELLQAQVAQLKKVNMALINK